MVVLSQARTATLLPGNFGFSLHRSHRFLHTRVYTIAVSKMSTGEGTSMSAKLEEVAIACRPGRRVKGRR